MPRNREAVPQDVEKEIEDFRTKELPELYKLRSEYEQIRNEFLNKVERVSENILVNFGMKVDDLEQDLDSDDVDELERIVDEVMQLEQDIKDAYQGMFQDINLGDIQEWLDDLDKKLRKFVA